MATAPMRMRTPLASAMPPTMEMARTTLSTTAWMRAMTSRASMALTLGYFDTMSYWRRARASGATGPRTKPTNVWGARASAPGRKTNMKPPLRESSQRTRRTLVTLASKGRPATSNLHLIADVDREALVDALLDRDFLLGIGHECGLPCPELTGRDFLVLRQVGSIGDRIFAGERAAAAHVGIALEVDVASPHARDPGPQRRDDPRRRVTLLTRIEQRSDAVGLIGLDVDEKEIRPALPDADDRLGDQVLL